MLMQVFGIESDDKAAIISGILGMIGGVSGAFGAYFVATHQMNKQFQNEKTKEEKRKTEKILKVLKKLELLNSDAIAFIENFKNELSKPYSDVSMSRLKFREYDLKWIVSKVDAINDDLLLEGYDIDYLRFSRALTNMYIDIIGFNNIPEEYKKVNLEELTKAVVERKGIFISFDKYLKEHINDVQKQIDNLI